MAKLDMGRKVVSMSLLLGLCRQSRGTWTHWLETDLDALGWRLTSKAEDSAQAKTPNQERRQERKAEIHDKRQKDGKRNTWMTEGQTE